jgi:DNA-directed RNA polymerase specialized sigma subunit
MRSTKKKNHYFTKEHEQAIVDYANTRDVRIRTDLYIKYIEPAFSEMVDKVVFTYKFTTLPNIDSLREECKIWLTTILDKYDPNKGSKAFSYFSVITKNWFIHRVKKTNTRIKREASFEDITGEIEQKYLASYNPYDHKREEAEFWNFLWTEIETWDTGTLKENEKKVLEAVKILLSSPDDIEIFNKKAIYLYIREITGLNTKQVVNNLNKMRVKYRIFKGKWNRGDI